MTSGYLAGIGLTSSTGKKTLWLYHSRHRKHHDPDIHSNHDHETFATGRRGRWGAGFGRGDNQGGEGRMDPRPHRCDAVVTILVTISSTSSPTSSSPSSSAYLLKREDQLQMWHPGESKSSLLLSSVSDTFASQPVPHFCATVLRCLVLHMCHTQCDICISHSVTSFLLCLTLLSWTSHVSLHSVTLPLICKTRCAKVTLLCHFFELKIVHCCTVHYIPFEIWVVKYNRWSIQIPKRQYRDHLVGQLTRLKITCGVQNFYPFLFHLRTNLLLAEAACQ